MHAPSHTGFCSRLLWITRQDAQWVLQRATVNYQWSIPLSPAQWVTMNYQTNRQWVPQWATMNTQWSFPPPPPNGLLWTISGHFPFPHSMGYYELSVVIFPSPTQWVTMNYKWSFPLLPPNWVTMKYQWSFPLPHLVGYYEILLCRHTTGSEASFI